MIKVFSNNEILACSSILKRCPANMEIENVEDETYGIEFITIDGSMAFLSLVKSFNAYLEVNDIECDDADSKIYVDCTDYIFNEIQDWLKENNWIDHHIIATFMPGAYDFINNSIANDNKSKLIVRKAKFHRQIM